MAEEITIDREKLKDLLKAAYGAYKAESKPPAESSDEWAEWYVNYMLEHFKATADSDKTDDEKSSEVEVKEKETPAAQTQAKEETVEAEESKDKAAVSTSSEAVKVEAAVPDRSSTLIQADSNTDATEPGDRRETAKAGVDGPPSSTEPDLGALQVCPTCAHRNRPGVLLCENCGTNLLTGQQSGVGTRDLRSEPEEVEVEPEASSALESTEQEAVVTAGSGVFSGDMYLRIEIDGGPEPIVIKPKSEDMILGRRDPTTGATPEVDLTAFAGYRMGVSRRHASLALKNNRLSLWDMGSSNGTFINGTRLTPHQPNPVRDGDEVRLGQMVIHLFFQKNA